MNYLERSREFWVTASKFPLNKEDVYPTHAKAHNFDRHHGVTYLEYGVGAGSDCLSALRRGNYVYATDIVPENVKVATKNVEEAKYSDHCTVLLLEESARIPLPSESIDVINCHGTLHHIKDPEPVLREFYRLLKPGGMLYCMLYSEVMWMHFQTRISQLCIEKQISPFEAFCHCTDSGGPYAKPYTEGEAFDLFEKAGFLVENVVSYGELKDFFRTYWCRKE